MFVAGEIKQKLLRKFSEVFFLTLYIYIDRPRVIKVLVVGDQNKMIQMTVIIVQDTL